MVQETPRNIPFHRPTIDVDDLKAVEECLLSGWLTTGPKALAFERAFAERVDGRHAVSLNSCTAALHLSLLSLGIGPGDEVITSPITFASTANVILHVGAMPVFADVEPERLTLDPNSVESGLTAKTKAIIPVHFAGHPCDMDAFMRLGKERHIPIIADAAHAIETEQGGKRSGTMGDVICYSFYANKNITTGEGGMAVTQKKAIADKMRILRLHGMTRDAWKRYVPGAYKHWDVVALGWKYNMSDIQAALGLSQLKRMDEWWKRREALTQMYHAALKDIPGIQTLKDRLSDKSARHLFVILVDQDAGISRDQVMEGLQKQGIGVGVHFRALHLMKHYQTIGFERGLCPVAEDASDRILSLPLFPSMFDSDVEQVAEALRDIMERRSG